jgi:glutamate-5-semialdehyde dehydrogenase
MDRLDRLEAGTPIPLGGDRVVRVGEELAAAFQPGDALVVLQTSGDLLHVPAAERIAAADAVGAAVAAFARMGEVSDAQIDDFYERFATALEDDDAVSPILTANAEDVERARERGRSTTRLVLSETMRRDMVDGLRGWKATPRARGRVVRTVSHDGWRVEEIVDRLGVVGFVFEGRPNVFADATGVLRYGNTVVFRIGSDALGTARAMMDHAVRPSLRDAGLPDGAVSLVDSSAHAAGWAMFSDPRLALAVARGSGAAVSQLGQVARQAGTPASLHGTGGAWIVASASADEKAFRAAVLHSLDRKVCNTLNTCCIVAERVHDLVPAFLDALTAAGERRGAHSKLHVEHTTRSYVPDEWFERTVTIVRADGAHDEPQAEAIDRDQLGTEWEWEESPEVTLVVVDSVDEAVDLFNTHSPRLAASLLSDDDSEHERFFATVEAPFVGTGFTRWVDGQYALGTPELGLSNWERGRLFGRSGILSGDSIFTVRSRAVQL